MSVKSPLGPQQLRWLKRIRVAGGVIELESGRNAGPTAWIPVEGGSSIRLPVRMFESLVDQELLKLFEDKGSHKIWWLLDDQEWERS